jgi:hypothetical protein
MLQLFLLLIVGVLVPPVLLQVRRYLMSSLHNEKMDFKGGICGTDQDLYSQRIKCGHERSESHTSQLLLIFSCSGQIEEQIRAISKATQGIYKIYTLVSDSGP